MGFSPSFWASRRISTMARKTVPKKGQILRQCFLRMTLALNVILSLRRIFTWLWAFPCHSEPCEETPTMVRKTIPEKGQILRQCFLRMTLALNVILSPCPKKRLGHNAYMTVASRPLKGAHLNNPRCKPGVAAKIDSGPWKGPTIDNKHSDILHITKICHW